MSLQMYLPWLARHSEPYQNHLGEVHTNLPERLPHVNRSDTITHICREGERLIDIAVYYFRNEIDRPVDCWEIIAQFQEDPILDGSVPLEAGKVLLIPSMDYVNEVALGDSLKETPVL